MTRLGSTRGAIASPGPRSSVVGPNIRDGGIRGERPILTGFPRIRLISSGSSTTTITLVSASVLRIQLLITAVGSTMGVTMWQSREKDRLPMFSRRRSAEHGHRPSSFFPSMPYGWYLIIKTSKSPLHVGRPWGASAHLGQMPLHCRPMLNASYATSEEES